MNFLVLSSGIHPGMHSEISSKLLQAISSGIPQNFPIKDFYEDSFENSTKDFSLNYCANFSRDSFKNFIRDFTGLSPVLFLLGILSWKPLRNSSNGYIRNFSCVCFWNPFRVSFAYFCRDCFGDYSSDLFGIFSRIF